MNDPNVKAFPIYATAVQASDLSAYGFRSAADIIAESKNNHPDYLIDGKTAYEFRIKPVIDWVDSQMRNRGWSVAGKTDFEKTTIIRQFVEAGLLEEMIGLWRPEFRFTDGDCVPIAEAVYFMMISMNFESFKIAGCTVDVAHAFNAYWDNKARAVRFIDAQFSFGVWNLYVDELAEKRFILD